MPTRGTLGNGLREVTGAAIGSGGSLNIESRGHRRDVTVDLATGNTEIKSRAGYEDEPGTKVTVHFGPNLPKDESMTAWADMAIRMAGPSYVGNNDPGWYDINAFSELLKASPPDTTVKVIAERFGCLIEDGRPARDISIDDAQGILTIMQEATPNHGTGGLLPVGPDFDVNAAYVKSIGTVRVIQPEGTGVKTLVFEKN